MRSDYNQEEGASYFPDGMWSPIFKGTLTQARDEAERFRHQEDEYACGVYIYTKRNETWQEVASYLGHPDY
jgi:hypothetical protein